jgi:hypothetical protein
MRAVRELVASERSSVPAASSSSASASGSSSSVPVTPALRPLKRADFVVAKKIVENPTSDGYSPSTVEQFD